MTFLGVDLAWGQRHQTGLAEVTADGDLVTLTQRVTDREILDWLQDRTAGPVVVAFDAPLIVNNEVGSRLAERTVGHLFGRYRASCHPSSRSNPHFADGGRAKRLAHLLGLELDPFAPAQRRGMEVYPHPAIVMLFGLEEVLRYKNKPGRTLGSRRAEMLTLMDWLEGLTRAVIRLDVSASDEWSVVRRHVENTTTMAGLSRVEDSIDAVVCAYVALHSVHRPERTAVLGLPADGCIVVPINDEIYRRLRAESVAGWPVKTMEHSKTVGMTADPVALDPTELDTALAALPGWKLDQGALITAYAAPSAAAALALIAAIGEAAESKNHHPDVDWRYDRVFVLTTTHQVGGKVTALDVEMAQQIAVLAAAAGVRAEPDQARVGG